MTEAQYDKHTEGCRAPATWSRCNISPIINPACQHVGSMSITCTV